MFGDKKRLEKRLRATGTQGTAEIMTVAPGHFAHTNGPEAIVSNTELDWKVKLRITPPGAAAFEIEKTIRLPQLSSPGVGQLLEVTLPGRPPYKAVARHFVGPMAMWKFAAGKTIMVAVDPKDDARVVVGLR